MNCDVTNEALEAYAVDALPADELAAVEQHLMTCRRHDEALAELRATAAMLAESLGEMEPPGGLRSRMLLALDAEVASRQRPLRQRRPLEFPPPWRPAPYAIAAALVLLIGGLIAWNLALQFGGDDGAPATVSAQLEGEGSGTVFYLAGRGIAILDVQLPAIAPQRAYQAWGIVEGSPISLGLVAADGITALNADLSAASAVAITEEPAGGSDQPTSEPLAVAQLPATGD
jgi:anti-sigma-K factor RskA